MKKYILNVLLFTLLTYSIQAQESNFKAISIGFYNLENLFDYEHDTLKNDYEFLPSGKRAWNEDRYREKLANMAYVISQIGTDVTPAGLSILGVAEIENRRVLEDLVKQSTIADRNYQIVHYESPDYRGIDVGLLYNPSHFTPTASKPIPLDFIEDGDTLFTREILAVEGILDGDSMHILVNHWPSRRGGEKRSAPKRNQGAQACKDYIDSLKLINPDVKVIVMGDLNDDPSSESVRSYLLAETRVKDTEPHEMFNPMYDYYRRGLGSNAYRDNWSLFDQLIISPGLLDQEQDGYFYYKALIFNKKFLIQRTGQYKGYPFRTFSFDKYQAGYSDHFPVYLYLVKKV